MPPMVSAPQGVKMRVREYVPHLPVIPGRDLYGRDVDLE